jgi:hypothetical protein
MSYQFSYKDILGRAERITWRVEDIIGGDKKLDFMKPFMPESLARTSALEFLSARERLQLNHIRANAYLGIFGLVEEFILPFVVDFARADLTGDSYQSRAFLEFANEEAKHIHLFRTFAAEFRSGFGVSCDVIGPASEVARHVLSHPRLSVALLTLHIEWMTQLHFIESIRDDADLDPQFKNLLLHHWSEEYQHAQLDTLMVEQLARGVDQVSIDAGIDGYLQLGAFLDEGLKRQTAFDLGALELAAGRTFSGAERDAFMIQQHQANRWTYIGSGMSHMRFQQTLRGLNPEKAAAIEAAVATFK